MPEIATGVSFDTIAREWRFKWSSDDEKKSLVDAQKVLVEFTDRIKASGAKSVQRVVCGGCLDFKVIIALDAATFGTWSAVEFAPEAEFLAAIKSIPGITNVETQTYTLMPVL
jgi:uncharacterized membrane protein